MSVSIAASDEELCETCQQHMRPTYVHTCPECIFLGKTTIVYQIGNNSRVADLYWCSRGPEYGSLVAVHASRSTRLEDQHDEADLMGVVQVANMIDQDAFPHFDNNLVSMLTALKLAEGRGLVSVRHALVAARREQQATSIPDIREMGTPGPVFGRGPVRGWMEQRVGQLIAGVGGAQRITLRGSDDVLTLPGDPHFHDVSLAANPFLPNGRSLRPGVSINEVAIPPPYLLTQSSVELGPDGQLEGRVEFQTQATPYHEWADIVAERVTVGDRMRDEMSIARDMSTHVDRAAVQILTSLAQVDENTEVRAEDVNTNP